MREYRENRCNRLASRKYHLCNNNIADIWTDARELRTDVGSGFRESALHALDLKS